MEGLLTLELAISTSSQLPHVDELSKEAALWLKADDHMMGELSSSNKFIVLLISCKLPAPDQVSEQVLGVDSRLEHDPGVSTVLLRSSV